MKYIKGMYNLSILVRFSYPKFNLKIFKSNDIDFSLIFLGKFFILIWFSLKIKLCENFSITIFSKPVIAFLLKLLSSFIFKNTLSSMSIFKFLNSKQVLPVFVIWSKTFSFVKGLFIAFEVISSVYEVKYRFL